MGTIALLRDRRKAWARRGFVVSTTLFVLWLLMVLM